MASERELITRIQELESRERDLLLAAELGRDLLDKNTDLELENKRIKEENQSLQHKLSLHKNRSKGVQGEIEDITGKSIQLEEELIANRKLYQRTTTELKQQVQQLISKNESYEMEITQLAVRNEEITRRNKELKSLNNRLEESQRTFQELAVEPSDIKNIQAYQQEVNTLRETASELKTLKRAHEELLMRSRMVEDENASLQEEVAEKQDLLKAVNSLIHANQCLQDEQKEYKALLKEAQASNARLTKKRENMSLNNSQGAMDELIEGEVEKQIQVLLEQRKQSLANEFMEKAEIDTFDDSDSLAAEFLALEPVNETVFVPEPDPLPAPPPVIPTCSVGCQVDMENLHSSLYQLGNCSDDEEEKIQILAPVVPPTPEIEILEPVQDTVIVECVQEPTQDKSEQNEVPEPEPLAEHSSTEEHEPVNKESKQIESQKEPIQEPQIINEAENEEKAKINEETSSRQELEALELKIKELESEIAELQHKAKQHTKETRVLRGTIKQLGTVHDQYRIQIKKLEEKNSHVHNKYRTMIDEFERKFDNYKEKEISVLEQLFRLRERFSYAQKVVKSPTMKTVLKIDELYIISKAVIESVTTDIKKLMEKETEEKYFGRGNELAYQLYEMFLNNADLYAKQNRLLEHVTEVKTKYNTLLLKHKELSGPQSKPFWQRIFNRGQSTGSLPEVSAIPEQPKSANSKPTRRSLSSSTKSTQ